eukprot:gene5965-6204_t
MDTYIVNERGEKVLSGSRRPDGTIRKERRIRAGYIPQDEQATYQSQGVLARQNIPKCPGLDSAEASSSAAAAKSKAAKKNEKRKTKKAVEATTGSSSQEQVPSKKVRQCQALVERQAAGDLLSPQEQDKVAKMAAWQEEIMQLEHELAKLSTNARAVTTSAQQQLKDWLDIDQPLLWQGNEEQALSPYSPADQLPAPWKDCLQMDLLTGQQLHHPPGRALDIPGPLVQRQVLLRSTATSPVVLSEGQLSVSPSGVPLVYAASWWASDTVDQYLADKALPIWVSLSKGHLELYREIQLVECGHNPELEKHFGCAGPFWGRQYYFWHNGKPLTLIHERVE